MPEPTTPLHQLDADLIVVSPIVEMESEILEPSPELVLHPPLLSTKHVISLQELQLATLKPVATPVVMEPSPATNNVITVVASELNPTTETNPTNVERDAFYLSVVMVLLISVRIVILEPAMV